VTTTTETATREGIAPEVRLEPCAAFCAGRDAALPLCDACGWLEDDHAPPITDGPRREGAVVTDLPRRYPPRIERKAS
jgi:hypothetical protein